MSYKCNRVNAIWPGHSPRGALECAIANTRTRERRQIVSEHKTNIVVDGTPHEWDQKEISYEQVVNLAYDNNPPTGEFVLITVAYRRGHDDKHEGELEAGDSVKVKDGMIFDVTATDRS
jgi:Multiubiquitin